MIRKLKVAGLALAAVLAFAPLASARPPYPLYGPPYYGWYGWYGPGWWGWYGPGWYRPYVYAPRTITGNVKIETKAKDSAVYVDGGYSGTVKELGTFRLTVGGHDIELRHNQESVFKEHVDVIAGRTIDIKVPKGESRGF